MSSDYETLLDEMNRTHANNVTLVRENAELRKLLEQVTDISICKIEGVAFELRRIAGYVDGPYPPLEREST